MTRLLVSALMTASLIVLALAALQDLRARIVPNRMVVAIAVLGLLLGAVTRPASLWINVLAALLVFLALGVLAHFDILGAGDAKLMAAVTLLVPPEDIVLLLLVISLIGGVISGAYLVLHHRLKRRRAQNISLRNRRSAFARWWRNERARIVDGRSVPYALAISSGTATYVVTELSQCLSATSC